MNWNRLWVILKEKQPGHSHSLRPSGVSAGFKSTVLFLFVVKSPNETVTDNPENDWPAAVRNLHETSLFDGFTQSKFVGIYSGACLVREFYCLKIQSSAIRIRGTKAAGACKFG